jgi:hypothetical protein
MSALTEFQKKRCPHGLGCEDWSICSKCPNGRVTEGQFAGRHAHCTLEATIPRVFTVIGKNKKEILKALPAIKKEMKKGFNRGRVGEVFWNMDAKVPSYFTYDYDDESRKYREKP